MKHMKDNHKDIVCKKFRENKWSYGTRCMFSQKSTPAQNVERSQTRNQTEAPFCQAQVVFREAPTTGQPNLIAGRQGNQMTLTHPETHQKMISMDLKMNQMMLQLNQVMAQMGLTTQ